MSLPPTDAGAHPRGDRPAVVLVDAGLGNLHSVEKALARAALQVGTEVVVSADPDRIARADRLVVPGQGAFADCERSLAPDGPLAQAIRVALGRGAPYLGICLGLQVLFDSSEEAPGCRGLGVFRGAVRRLPAGHFDPSTGTPLKVPHMGWSPVHAARAGVAHPALAGVDDRGAPFYFVHSYHAVPDDPSLVAGVADFGPLRITAAVARDNVVAVQFHPEKSQRAGLELLESFLRWRP